MGLVKDLISKTFVVNHVNDEWNRRYEVTKSIEESCKVIKDYLFWNGEAIIDMLENYNTIELFNTQNKTEFNLNVPSFFDVVDIHNPTKVKSSLMFFKYSGIRINVELIDNWDEYNIFVVVDRAAMKVGEDSRYSFNIMTYEITVFNELSFYELCDLNNRLKVYVTEFNKRKPNEPLIDYISNAINTFNKE